MLKGLFERVFVNSGLYTGMRYDRGYFRGKYALCSLTTNDPKAVFGNNGQSGNFNKTIIRQAHS
jgi:NAD(P)H dehydrogenase (quinone)